MRQLLDNVQRTVGEINTSYAAVQGALRGAAGAVHFSSLEGGRDAQGRHAEAQAMAQADREARQEAALRDILVKVEVWRGEVEGLAVRMAMRVSMAGVRAHACAFECVLSASRVLLSICICVSVCCALRVSTPTWVGLPRTLRWPGPSKH